MRRTPLVAKSTVEVRVKGAALGPFQPQQKMTLPGTFPTMKPPVVAVHKIVPRKMGTGTNLSRQIVKQEVEGAAIASGAQGIYNTPLRMPINAPVVDRPYGVDPVTLHPVYPSANIARRVE